MCGIVGCVGAKNVVEFLLDGLTALEYRGYDSAGMAVCSEQGTIDVVKRAGKVGKLREAAHEVVQAGGLRGCAGIAHTRWATHGPATQTNAHPHASNDNRLVIVHNGVIENFQELKDELCALGSAFVSDTDTEVIAHAIARYYEGDLLQAVKTGLDGAQGSYAIVAMHQDNPHELIVARCGSPIVVAQNDEGSYVASGDVALNKLVDRYQVLENDQFARLTPTSVTYYDAHLQEIELPFIEIDREMDEANKGDYPDFMLKEINEQPRVLERALADRLTDAGIELDGMTLTDEQVASIDRIFIAACGTSYCASLVAKQLIERWAHIPVEVELASEFESRTLLVTPHTLGIIVTQSGETADTMYAADCMRELGAKILAVTNVASSRAARESDAVLLIKAGIEVAVASTKAYTAQITALALVALFLAQHKQTMSRADIEQVYRELQAIPDVMRTITERQDQVMEVAHACRNAKSSLYLGRGLNVATAYEGALKLKELSYLHAEGYASGEMKHGPIALIDKGFPVVAVVLNDEHRNKTLANMQEVGARGACIIAVANDGDHAVADLAHHVLWVPSVPEYLSPLVAIMPLQYLSRQVALDRGCDVDQPRNLAKSVTV